MPQPTMRFNPQPTPVALMVLPCKRHRALAMKCPVWGWRPVEVCRCG